MATDVLARGIDIKDINLVVNYNVPGDGEDYVHRIGRTARADADGVALTLVNEEEMYKLAAIEKLIGSEINKLNIPAHIGESPIWNPNRPKGGYQRAGSGNRRPDGNKNASFKPKKSGNKGTFHKSKQSPKKESKSHFQDHQIIRSQDMLTKETDGSICQQILG